jgi:outer membrane protein, heavy metal efflux system
MSTFSNKPAYSGGFNAAAGTKPAAVSFLQLIAVFLLPVLCCLLFITSVDAAETLDLQKLISEAQANNPEIRAAGHKASASGYRAPQAMSLPDPTFSVGYQNEGFRRYTYGESKDAQWMYSASQTIPFPGKLGLKGNAAQKEAENAGAGYDAVRLKTISKIKELYFDLYVAYKTIDLLNERTSLYSAIEGAALSRYSAGKGSQQEVLMAQTEKYMIIEKVTMLQQKIETLEAALNITLGRLANAPLGQPADLAQTFIPNTLDELILITIEKSPEIRGRDKMVSSAEAKLSFAKKDYIPDFTFTGSYFARGNGFDNMWSVTTGINIPIFSFWKQRNAVNEADASLAEARSMKESIKLAVTASIRENYSQFKAAEKLMPLYKEGLIPKGVQDIDLSLSNYKTGSADALTVITRIKAVIDYEISYWNQFAEHEKAAARLEAITSITFSAQKSE